MGAPEAALPELAAAESVQLDAAALRSLLRLPHARGLAGWYHVEQPAAVWLRCACTDAVGTDAVTVCAAAPDQDEAGRALATQLLADLRALAPLRPPGDDG